MNTMQRTDAIEGFLEWQRSTEHEEGRALIAEAGDDDVLLGRGTSQAKRPANARYKMIVQQNRERYFAATGADEKREITEQMVAEIGGRLLRRAGGGARSGGGGSSGWIEVKGEEARVKVAQALQYQQRHAKRSGRSGSASSSFGYSSDGSRGNKKEKVLSKSSYIRKSRSLPPTPTTKAAFERGLGFSVSLLAEQSIIDAQHNSQVPNEALPFHSAVRKSKSDSDVPTTTTSTSDFAHLVPPIQPVDSPTSYNVEAPLPILHGDTQILPQESLWALHNHPNNFASRYNPAASVATARQVVARDPTSSSNSHNFLRDAPEYPTSSLSPNVQQHESLFMSMTAASMWEIPAAGSFGAEIGSPRHGGTVAQSQTFSPNNLAMLRMPMESFNMDNIRGGSAMADDEQDDCRTIGSEVIQYAEVSESGLRHDIVPTRSNRAAASGSITSGDDDDFAMAFSSLLSFDGFVNSDLDDNGIDTTALPDMFADAYTGDDLHDIGQSLDALHDTWTETETATATNTTGATQAQQQVSGGSPPLSPYRIKDGEASLHISRQDRHDST